MNDIEPTKSECVISVEQNIENKKDSELFRVVFKVGDISQEFESSTVQGVLELIALTQNQ